MEMLTILVGDFSNLKAFADKTVEAFFVFARIFEMAIGEKAKFELSQTKKEGKEGGRSKRIERDRDSILYIMAFFIKNLVREIILWAAAAARPPAPGSCSTAYDAPGRGNNAKKHLLIANYATNTLQCPYKALQTACNALGIYFYTLRIKRLKTLVCPIIAHMAIYAPILCPLPCPAALYTPTNSACISPSLLTRS